MSTRRTVPVRAAQVASASSLARTALGVVALVRPSVPLAPWIGADAERGTTRLLGRALGARDVALGIGALRALRTDSDPALWLVVAAGSDAADFAATLLAWREVPALGRVAVSSATLAGALVSVATARSLRGAPDPGP